MDRAFEVQEKHAAAIQKLNDAMSALERRVIILEQREEVIIAKCQGAAAAAATVAGATAMADLARRIGAMEERGRIAQGGGEKTQIAGPKQE